MNQTRLLDRAVHQVVSNHNCSGCGACTIIDQGLAMRLDNEGFARPVRHRQDLTPTGAVRTFDAVCPGRRVGARRPVGSTRHPTLGPIVSSWEVWAADPAIRHRGSSGGALTALSSWLVETGQVSAVSTATVDQQQPRRTVAVTLTTREEALAAAGSRYAPVSVLGPGALDPSTAVVAKPCEISAARALLDSTTPHFEPLLLSFFCAGTPSQHATDQLLVDLGVPADADLSDLWYRGRGWPGSFTAVRPSGGRVETTYERSWGQHLGRATQWRCKVCPDGVGESSDISAADFWRADERGYPMFGEEAGRSALLARTARGHALLTQAFEAGVLHGRPLDPDELAGVQPLQTSRRSSLLGRLIGTRASGRQVPRFVGFGLIRLAAPRVRETVRTARASFRRIRATSASSVAPGEGPDR